MTMAEMQEPVQVTAEARNAEGLLRSALASLDAAAASLRWIEREGGPSWSGAVPSSVDVEDLAQRVRHSVNKVVLYTAGTPDDV